ncbi:hypothetical protein RI054_41g148550 [Pseudoscourfieldia marina]
MGALGGLYKPRKDKYRIVADATRTGVNRAHHKTAVRQDSIDDVLGSLRTPAKREARRREKRPAAQPETSKRGAQPSTPQRALFTTLGGE